MIANWGEILINLFLTCWVLKSWLQTLLWNSQSGLIYKNQILTFIFSILMCPKCFSFWFTLLITFNPIMAAAVSYLIMWSDKLEQNIKSKL